MVSMTYIEKREASAKAKVTQYIAQGERIPPKEKDKMMAISGKKGVCNFHVLMIYSNLLAWCRVDK